MHDLGFKKTVLFLSPGRAFIMRAHIEGLHGSHSVLLGPGCGQLFPFHSNSQFATETATVQYSRLIGQTN